MNVSGRAAAIAAVVVLCLGALAFGVWQSGGLPGSEEGSSSSGRNVTETARSQPGGPPPATDSPDRSKPLGVAGGKTIYPSPNLSLPPDYVFARVNTEDPDDPRPVRCSMERGTFCRIEFTGTYRLSSFETGSIQAGAYEDGHTEPDYKTALPIPRKGSSPWFIKFPYVVSDKAKTVTFKAVLLDPQGRQIAEGAPNTFRIREKSSG